MDDYYLKLQVDNEELNEIFKALEKAKETIYDCYFKLQSMPICTVTKKEDAASCNKEGSTDRDR